ncbi:MAG TPA: CpXC domain-containing protein, partial [Chloroflexaceae bacterium]|nr:CpXC domain-containing protein [Chloroflexaceae bacterium]
MPPVAPQPVQLTCPNCGTPFRAGIYTLVDVTQQPELKAALLSGQLNVAVCPNCRTASMLGAPLVYHDAEKQLCLVYFPQELNSRPEEQERFVGEATSFLLRSLPPEAPRAHLLAPRRFLTLPSLLDAVLEADGISRETLDRQRAHVELISLLADALADEEQFDALVAERQAELTPELFATLAAFVEATPPEQAESRALLEQLRERLAERIGEEGAPDDAEVDAAVDELVAASDEELELAVAERRELIDYAFFAALTARIEAAEAAGDSASAGQLTARRARILAIVEELDSKAQELFEAGSMTLREVFEAPDPLAALHERADRVDEAFLMVLSANAAAAQRAGQPEVVATLEHLSEAAIEIIQSR